MFKSRFTIAMSLLLSILLMTLLGRIQDERPILEGLVDANSEEAFAMYELYEDYHEAPKVEAACVALNQAIHMQTDEQKKIRWEAEFLTLDCQLTMDN